MADTPSLTHEKREESKRKLYLIAAALLDKALAGAGEWEESDLRGRFVATFGSGSILLQQSGRAYSLTLQDSRGARIESVEVGGGLYPDYSIPDAPKERTMERMLA